MDGFALRAADTPGTLPVVARVAAGRPASRALAAGEAMGIATGGVVPEGADAVVPIEHVTDEGDTVVVPQPVATGDNVRPRGGDVVEGEPVLAAGTRPDALAACRARGRGRGGAARARGDRVSRSSRPAPSSAGRASRSATARSTSRTA